MIDLKDLRENPTKYRDGCRKKGMSVDLDRLLDLDSRRRALLTEQEQARAQQRGAEKEAGPFIGQLKEIAKSGDQARLIAMAQQLGAASQIQAILNPSAASDAGANMYLAGARVLEDLAKKKPLQLKARIQDLESQIAAIEPDLNAILLTVPLPPDADVPVGTSAEDNVELRRWNPSAGPNSPGGVAFDPNKSFEANRGFKPKTHIDLVRDLNLADFNRGVKMAGTRSYVLTGDGFLLHNAVLRYAFDFMTLSNGFKAMSVPVLVKESCMVGTGFFPAGREQAYLVDETNRGGTGLALQTSASDLFLTGTGEVGLMGIHEGEILDEAQLPLKYTTVSTCFRREAGAAGKDTAGLYRIHQFDKVEQVVICKADEAESRAWHKTMLGYVEQLLQSLGLPHRLLQCCTADLGPKNADMIDVESWMPGRGESGGASGVSQRNTPTGAYGETHSASRLYDYQCRRLNMRYRPGGEQGKGPTTFCHSLNNTVAAAPRILIPILEMWQNADGTVTIPPPLRPYMGNKTTIS